MKRHRRKRLLVHALLIPTTIILVSPILWLLLLSFRPTSVILNGINSVTSPEFVLDNYVSLFNNYNILQYLFNSLIAAIIPAVVSVVCALFAAYALVRFRFPGHRLFLSLPLFAQIVPLIQLALPFYAIMLMLGLLNTYIAVILAHISIVLPITIWMMTGYLRSVPPEIEEAAMVDGCSRVGAIFHVILPVAMPGITATALVAFLQAWAEFLFAFVLTSSDAMRVLAVALYTFIPSGMAPASWGLLFAMATVFMAPALLLFVLLQSSLRRGLALGAVAGR